MRFLCVHDDDCLGNKRVTKTQKQRKENKSKKFTREPTAHKHTHNTEPIFYVNFFFK